MVVTEARGSIARKAKLFRSLAEPSRLVIVEALRSGERNVTELVDLTGLSQSNVSNHLACLLDCGLVVREARGRYSIYSLADAGLEALLAEAEVLAAGAGSRFEACARYATAP
jgi:ArsR family transcriptional regulator, cadmium/lead-responsive transcriptional repressor